MDTSLNPSLDESEEGSVAGALEELDEIVEFGGVGSIAAAAAITTAIQAIPLKRTGYCGLMLPVCEDRRLAALAKESPSAVSINTLMSISSVCGVGIDTVPLSGSVSAARLAALYLDIAGLAARWSKPLSVRVFPIPGAITGETTLLDSPYLIDTNVFRI
jgi:uncharacterized protein (UPF0210 family)